MRKIIAILIVGLSVALIACRQQGKQNVSPDSANATDSLSADAGLVPPVNAALWRYDLEKDTICQLRPVKRDTLTADGLVRLVNAVYTGKVCVELVHVSNDTIFVKIPDAEYLTQRMGTSGADEFMISSTFTLTELPDIRYVDFDFEIGDHASPGTYTRQYFQNWISSNRKLNESLK